jgi:hypothetical protein
VAVVVLQQPPAHGSHAAWFARRSVCLFVSLAVQFGHLGGSEGEIVDVEILLGVRSDCRWVGPCASSDDAAPLEHPSQAELVVAAVGGTYVRESVWRVVCVCVWCVCVCVRARAQADMHIG